MIIRNRKEIRGNKVIWKYLSWDKFFDLLISKELYLSRTSEMTDKNECCISQKNVERIMEYINRIVPNNTLSLSIDDSLKNRSFINCWSMSRNESYALWKIYLSNAKSGVAIKTTVSHLENAIKEGCKNDDIYIMPVHYGSSISISNLDMDIQPIQKQVDIWRLTTKLQAYQYENEVRLICLCGDDSAGKRIKISSLDFIDELYFSPFNRCFVDTYTKVLQKIGGGLEKKVKKSGIDDQ